MTNILKLRSAFDRDLVNIFFSTLILLMAKHVQRVLRTANV